MQPELRRDLTRTVLAVLFIGALISACFWILRPFLPAVVWATMIVVATWPVLVYLENRLWKRRWLAVSVMTVTMLLVFIVPFSLALSAIVSHADEIAALGKTLSTYKLPPAPEWLAKLPVIGEKAAAAWDQVAVAGTAELSAQLAPYAGTLTRWFVTQIGGVGAMFVHFLLTVVIAAIMYVAGEDAVAGVRAFARRLASERGDLVVTLSGQAIRGVALGVVVTALIQATLAGLGLWAAGVPFASVLTAVMFMLAVAQIGVVPVLLLCLAWLYWQGAGVAFVGLLVWTLIVGTMDNFLRPILIKRGADLPLLLIFAGVIGGLIAFGLIGIFVGPVLLAVAYTLLAAWVRDVEPPPAQTNTSPTGAQDLRHGS